MYINKEIVNTINVTEKVLSYMLNLNKKYNLQLI